MEYRDLSFNDLHHIVKNIAAALEDEAVNKKPMGAWKDYKEIMDKYYDIYPDNQVELYNSKFSFAFESKQEIINVLNSYGISINFNDAESEIKDFLRQI